MPTTSCFSYPGDPPLSGLYRGAIQPDLPGLRRMPGSCFSYSARSAGYQEPEYCQTGWTMIQARPEGIPAPSPAHAWPIRCMRASDIDRTKLRPLTLEANMPVPSFSYPADGPAGSEGPDLRKRLSYVSGDLGFFVPTVLHNC